MCRERARTTPGPAFTADDHLVGSLGEVLESH